MTSRTRYANIDMRQTGLKIRNMFESAGYTPRMIQDYLHLSCVQPVYRWYKGIILPSVDNLFMLSQLLNVHMEDFLVKKNVVPIFYNMEYGDLDMIIQRATLYYKKICKSVAYIALD